MDNEKSQQSIKRKRSESESLVEDDFSKVTGKLHHGLKDVRRAAKKAKTFETQKLVKKLKGIRGKAGGNSDIVEYDEQLKILKDVEHEAVANTAIRSKIAKDRALTQHARFQEALTREIRDNVLLTIVEKTSAARVHSRLLSSKILSTEISSLCDDLRQLLGHETKKLRVEAVKGGGPKAYGVPKSSVSHERTLLASSGGAESENAVNNVDGTSQVSEITQDDAHSDADSWESGSISTDEDNEKGKKPASGKNPLKPLKGTFEQSNTTSTFLPSLSVGFVRGSDESDWSDSEAKIADSETKKNRRGQRARRAIWEKKYGKNANHKKMEPREQTRSSNKKNIQEGSSRGSFHQFNKQDHTRSSRKLEKPDHHPPLSRSTAGPNTAKKDSQPLHPSWEAKRKLKEKQGMGIIPSQGTKIKFSD